MSCDAFKFCPGCGKPIEHQRPEATQLTSEVRRIRMVGGGLYEAKCLDALALLKTHGPLSSIEVRQIGHIHLSSQPLNYLVKAGLVERLPLASGERWPKYRVLDG